MPGAVVDLIVRLRKELTDAGLDAGPDTIAWHLEHDHHVVVSQSTISRHLTQGGLVTPEPRKRPKSSYIRFEADLPNQCSQSDFTHLGRIACVVSRGLSRPYRRTTCSRIQLVSAEGTCAEPWVAATCRSSPDSSPPAIQTRMRSSPSTGGTHR